MVTTYIPNIDEEKEALIKLRQEARLKNLKKVRDVAKKLSLQRVREFQKVKELKLKQLDAQQQIKEQAEEDIKQNRASSLLKERFGEAYRNANILREKEQRQAQYNLEGAISRERRTDERCLRALQLERFTRTLKLEVSRDTLRQRSLAKPPFLKKTLIHPRPLLPASFSIPSSSIKHKEYYEDTRFHTVRNHHPHLSAIATAQTYIMEQDRVSQIQLEKITESAQRAEQRGQQALATVWIEKNKTNFMKALNWVHTKDKERQRGYLHSQANRDHVFPESDLKQKFDALLNEGSEKKIISEPKLETAKVKNRKGNCASHQKKKGPVTTESKNEKIFVNNKSQSSQPSMTQISSQQVPRLSQRASTNNNPQTDLLPVCTSQNTSQLNQSVPLNPTEVNPIPPVPPTPVLKAPILLKHEPSLMDLSSGSVSMFTDLSPPSVKFSRLSSSSLDVSLEPPTPSLSTMHSSTLEQGLRHVNSVVEELKSEFDSCLSFLHEDEKLFSSQTPCASLKKMKHSDISHSSISSFIKLTM
ncbi:hypothetical protein HMI54_012288 [Coelomomyces lativittatus]|nr:hypothetical protein HMI54_012288 [Coelomomyces lativittatus]